VTDVDSLLRDTLSDRAETAPAGTGLLARVHNRSRLIRRRRRVGTAGAGVAAVLLGVAGVPVVNGLLPGDAPGERAGGPTATKPVGTDDPTTPEPSRSDATPSPPPPTTAVLGPPTFTMPKVPFTAPTGVINGLAPAVPLFDGTPMIMHVHTDNDGKPMLMLHIGQDPGNFVTKGQDTPVQVRGVSGKLGRTTDPTDPGTVLTWTEPDGTPMVIVAQNIPDEKVIAYANGLKRVDSTVTAPFTFTELPQGVELDTVNASSMIFRLPGQASPAGDYRYKLGFLLNADGGGDAASWPLTVNGRKAQLVPQDDGGKILMVAQPNGFVLAVQVPVNLKISDDDLLRMAKGVTVNPSARGGRG
jgi:hypothetical protein